MATTTRAWIAHVGSAPPPQAERIHVGIGEIAVSCEPGTVMTAILGSCVGIVMLDRPTGLAGMAHVMLPDSSWGHGSSFPAKFADKAVPALIDAMRSAGAEPRRLLVAIAGGADVLGLPLAKGQDGIGARNVTATLAALARAGSRAHRQEVGGTGGRLLQVWVGPDQVVVRRPGAAPDELALLTPP